MVYCEEPKQLVFFDQGLKIYLLNRDAPPSHWRFSLESYRTSRSRTITVADMYRHSRFLEEASFSAQFAIKTFLQEPHVFTPVNLKCIFSESIRLKII